ncbi:helix-turn-helix domain-containing protein [Nocardia sp. XZ_19_385]|uniref:winged helix-turn-helix transcriptional regulator n=1 Tax=Nocardia sp. XZ_19_385 TaxID=2769488 RepID=UPI001890959E|nr:helix-turn-helix domain-containing protein [Nocardia sp. XZ_19_385]
MSLRHTAVTTAPPVEDSQEACDIREVGDRIGDKWSVLVIAELTTRTHRFRELQRAIPGISQRMLTLTLRRLQRDGFVERTVYPVVPAQVEYALTDTGRSLTELLTTIAGWAEQHRDGIMSSRSLWDTTNPSPTTR